MAVLRPLVVNGGIHQQLQAVDIVANNMPTFGAYLSVAANSVYNAFAQVPLNVKEFDTFGAFNNTGATVTLNGKQVPPYAYKPGIPGEYVITASVLCNVPGGAVFNYALPSIFKGTGVAAAVEHKRGVASNLQCAQVTATVFLDVDDYADFRVFVSGSGTVTPFFQGQPYTYMGATLVRPS